MQEAGPHNEDAQGDEELYSRSPNPEGQGGTPGFAFSRRGLLQAGATLGIASGMAGCAGLGLPNLTEYHFQATPVTVAPDLETPAYTLSSLKEETIERKRTILGTQIDIELTNQAALYNGSHDTLGLLSSPSASVVTQPQNPLASDSLRDILVGQAGNLILAALDLSNQSSVQWTRGPTAVETGQGELLGQTTDIKSFAGETKESGFVLITAARVLDAGDAVFAANGLQREGQAPSLVGSDGYVTKATVTDSVDRLRAVLPHVERGGAGIKLLESAQITTQGAKPDYIRLLASNQYDDKTLFGLSFAVELFDSQGTLIDHRTANLAKLGPDEQFEGYVPYVTDDVAGYAIDAAHSTREITIGSADAVEVLADNRDGDTVTIDVRNTLSRTVPYVSLEVTFYDEAGTVLATSKRIVAHIAAGERKELDVVYSPPSFNTPLTIADYSVDVLEYSGPLRYVR